MGTVTSVKVKEGDKVTAGDILMTIDNRDTAQRVAAAEAAFNEAQSARTSVGRTTISCRGYLLSGIKIFTTKR